MLLKKTRVLSGVSGVNPPPPPPFSAARARTVSLTIVAGLWIKLYLAQEDYAIDTKVGDRSGKFLALKLGDM
jgi:hypothetical protein